MFTGIIEEIGVISSAVKSSNGVRMSISCGICTEGVSIGGSIAVNGACLTAAEIGSDFFSADISQETLKLSNLGKLRPGNKVNLERAARFDSRIDGHIVTGHLDGTGRIQKRTERQGVINFEVALPQSLVRYCVKKGSVAIDGISLTINELTGNVISLLVIQHTIKSTALPEKRVGDILNIETDILAKYVERLFKD